MHGLMQDRSLDVPVLTRRAEQMFAHKRVVTATADGETTATWGQVVARARRLTAALDVLGVPRGARVGTFAWNSQRHVELYLGVPSGRRVLHTLNHRLFAAELTYILNDAGDDVLFVDRSLIATVWPVVEKAPAVRHVVLMDDGGTEEVPDDPGSSTTRRSSRRRPARHRPSRSTRTTPRASATPRARPGGPRACSTATARSSCIRC